MCRTVWRERDFWAKWEDCINYDGLQVNDLALLCMERQVNLTKNNARTPQGIEMIINFGVFLTVITIIINVLSNHFFNKKVV